MRVAACCVGDDGLERGDMLPGTLGRGGNESDASPGAEGKEELSAFEGKDCFVELVGAVEERVVERFAGVFGDVVGSGGDIADEADVDDERIAGDGVPELLELLVREVLAFDEDV